MTDANGFGIGYAYDEAGNLSMLTYPGCSWA
jgi:YD repeat-containing protein